MGTTSDKLTYLNTTKDKLKTAINYTGANITNDTFRSYPEKLYNAYIDIINNGTGTLYNNMPKVNGQGNNITLNNTEEAPMQLDLKGNIYQDSTTGKNLAQRIGGYLTADGTFKASNDDSFYFPVTQGETYIYNATGNRTLGAIYDNVPSNNATPISGTYSNNMVKNTPFTVSATGIMVIYANTPTSQDTINSFIVVKGSEIGDYEPYTNGPSPNPDYPQDIHIVSGNNEIKVEGENVLENTLETVIRDNTSGTWNGNVYTYAGMTFTYNNDKSITISGTNDSSTTRYFYLSTGLNPIVLLPSSYTRVLYNKNQDINTNVGIQARIDSAGGADIFGTGSASLRATTINEKTNIVSRIYVSGNATTNVTVYPMIVKGIYSVDTIPEYEPYQGYTKEINLSVENLFNPTTANLVQKGINSSAGTISGDNVTRLETDNLIYLEAGTYTIQNATCDNYWVWTYDENLVYQYQELMTTWYTGSSYTFTLTSNRYVRFLWAKHTNDDISLTENFNIQLEKGSKANSYTPYGTTPIELCKIGTYEDEFFKNTGKNLFDKDNANIIDCYVNVGENQIRSSTINKSLYIPIIGGLTYTISKIKTDRFGIGTTATIPEHEVALIDKVDNALATSLTLNTSSTAKYLCVHFWRNSDTLTEQEILDSIQIEQGSTATEYEPYGKDKWYLKKRIGKKTFTGASDEDWRIEHPTGIPNNFYLIINDAIGNQRITIINSIGRHKTSLSENYATYISSGKYLNFRCDEITSVVDFRAMLSNKNMIVCYQLETPVNILLNNTLQQQLNNLEQIKSKKPQTNISQENNDLPFNITATALEAI